MRKTMPESGLQAAEIKKALDGMAENDVDWRHGRAAVYVFFAGDDVYEVAKHAYTRFMSENGLGPAAFPSMKRMEEEVVSMGLGLLNAPETGWGSMTSGGTESIVMAVKAARAKARREGRVNSGGTIVGGRSLHPAFNKAAELMDLTVVRTPLRDDLTVDPAAIEAAVTDDTIMIVGSAPCFPYGLVDPIPALNDVAERRGLWLHVDACVGGYFAPFAEMNGVPLPVFDFRNAAVRSMSADVHKYGFAAKGASTVLYREREDWKGQVFRFDDWPNGTMVTPTLAGTRPGGAIAAAWAVMNYLGIDGYRDKARRVCAIREKLGAAVESIDGLHVLGTPQLGLIAYGSHDGRVDIHKVWEALYAKGWFTARTVEPDGIHLMLTIAHEPVIDDYIADLREAVDKVRAGRGPAAQTKVAYAGSVEKTAESD